MPATRWLAVGTAYLLCVASASAGVSPAGAAGPGKAALVIAECPQDGVEARVDCGHIRVPENSEVTGGREIQIHFVRARAVGPDPVPDPVFVLVGGPGEHASRSTAARLRSKARFLERRDVVIVDQRGTGRSNPLDCEEYDLEADPSGFQRLFDVDFFDAETMRRCRKDLESRADLTRHTASAIADDIDAVRAALGYERINLDGGSWGTRLGLEILRRHGDRVRSAILAGVAPATAILVETVARDFQDALDALVRDCRADAACAGAFPDFEAQLKEVLARIERGPATVELVNPGTGRAEPVRVRHAQLLTAIRFTLYSTQLSAALPLQVKAASEGDLAPISALLPELLYQLKNAVSEGMWASVKCAEELPFVDLERARAVAEGTLMGTLRLDQEHAICAVWPRGRVPDDYHDPVVSSVPVLLLTAELDPTSPARLGAQAAEHLANGTLVEVANRSHWGLGGNDCMNGIVMGFLEKGSGEGLDTSCATQFERPPFELPASVQDAPKLLGVPEITSWESPAAEHRLFYGDEPLQFGDLYLPEGQGPHPVIVFVHGGCWLSRFDISHSARLADALAAKGIAVWSLEYRRVGDDGGGWPGTFHDVARGADFLRDIAGEHHLDLERVIAAGHSAGGHLALWLGARAAGAVDEMPFETGPPLRLRGVLGLAPAPDLSRLHEREVCGHVVDELLGGSPAERPERYRLADATLFSPIGSAPKIVIVGAHDASWAPSGRHYFDVAEAQGADVRLIEAPESGHFEMIDPHSSTWPLVLDSARRLLGLED